MDLLKDLSKDLPPEGFALVDETIDQKSQELAEKLIAAYSDNANAKDALSELEAKLCDPSIVDTFPMATHLVVKLALSKLKANCLSKSSHISIIIPVYKEDKRLKRSDEEEIGENFLRRKVSTLQWLFDGTNVTWDLVVVDDGCPNGTGEIIEKLVEEEEMKYTSVLFLQDAIDQGHELMDALNLKSTRDSQKAGAVLYALSEVCKKKSGQEIDVVCFTDADTSANLGQTALLLYEIVEGKKPIAVGSRYGPNGCLSGFHGQEDTILGLTPHVHLLPLIMREFTIHTLLPPLRAITDTQCGFKAFLPQAVAPILPQMQDTKGSFDMEFLLRVATQHGGEEDASSLIAKVPIFWVDSVAGSNFYSDPSAADASYLKIMRHIANVRKLFVSNFTETEEERREAEEVADYVQSLDVVEFRRVIDSWFELHKETPFDFANRKLLSVEFFKKISAASED